MSGAKAFESGIMQGEIAADAFKENPDADKNGDGVFQYVVLEGEAGHQDAIVRTEYAVSTSHRQRRGGGKSSRTGLRTGTGRRRRPR